jgi:hypothetical protein
LGLFSNLVGAWGTWSSQNQNHLLRGRSTCVGKYCKKEVEAKSTKTKTIMKQKKKEERAKE